MLVDNAHPRTGFQVFDRSPMLIIFISSKLKSGIIKMNTEVLISEIDNIHELPINITGQLPTFKQEG